MECPLLRVRKGREYHQDVTVVVPIFLSFVLVIALVCL